MSEIRINLNESVRFKLTERGKEIYRHRFDGICPKYNTEAKVDDDGYTTMHLWEFMNEFGQYMSMGLPEVVKPLEIIYSYKE